jgi:hypothetical protein
LAWRSFIPIVFIVALVAACSPAQPSATPSRAPAVAVVTAPTATPTEDPPSVAPPTKKPAKTKKPKPTPTPVTWSDAYRTQVCAAIAALADAKPHLEAVAARLSQQNYPQARAEAFQIVALALQATDQIPTVKAWPQGEQLVALLTDSANSIGHGASTLIDGMASLDVNVMHAAGAEMDTGNGQLDQARAALQVLSATYGPAGC